MVCITKLSLHGNCSMWKTNTPIVSSTGLLSNFENVQYRNQKISPFSCVAFHASRSIFAACDERGHVFVFTIKSNRYAMVYHLGTAVTECCFNPVQKNELLVACADGALRCVDIDTKSLVCTLQGHKNGPTDISFQQGGNLALSASVDAVMLWDCRQWTRFKTLNAGPGVEMAKIACKDESVVAVCFRDDSIMMWTIDTFALKCRLTVPKHEQSPGLKCFNVSSDQVTVVACGRAPMLYVWNIQTQELIRIIELPNNLRHNTQIEFHQGTTSHPAGRAIVSVLGDDGKANFLNITSKSPKITMQVSAAPRVITKHASSSNTRYLASCTSDGHLLLHDLTVAKNFTERVKSERKENGLPSRDEENAMYARSAFTIGRGESRKGSKSKSLSSSIASNASSHKSKAIRRNSQKQSLMENNDADPVRTSTSLFQLARLTENETQVNTKRLESLLVTYGVYPEKYRLIIWKFLLQLPENNDAFVSLMSRGSHAAFVSLHEKYPIQSQLLFRRLLRVVSAIANWSPVFGEVPYLPALVFPFVKVCATDDLAAFEICVSVLLHWGSEWLQTFPHPPMRILTMIEDRMSQTDSELYDHFVENNINAQVYGWSLLRTLFTEVLAKEDWLRLWDHIFTMVKQPTFIYVVVYSYTQYFRSSLLSASDSYSIDAFFHEQNAIDMNAFLKMVYKVNKTWKVDSVVLADTDNPGANVNSKTKSWPLARGQYPAFHNFPKYVVDFQLQERERIALEEAQIVQKRQMMQDLEYRTSQLQTEHQKWVEEHRKMLTAEEERRTQAAIQERQRLAELKSLDEQARQRRLSQISRMEGNTQEMLQETAKIREFELGRLEDQLALQKEREEYELLSRREEERLAKLEFEASQRVKSIQMEREAEEKARELRRKVALQEKTEQHKDKLRNEAWKHEDEERRLRLRLEAEEKEKNSIARQELELERKMEQQHLARLMEKEKSLFKLKQERNLRRIAEEESERIQKNIELTKEEEKLRIVDERNRAHAQAVQLIETEESKSKRRMEVLEEDRRRHALQTETKQENVLRSGHQQSYWDAIGKSQAKSKKEIAKNAVKEQNSMEKVMINMDNETHKPSTANSMVNQQQASNTKPKSESNGSLSPKAEIHESSGMSDNSEFDSMDSSHNSISENGQFDPIVTNSNEKENLADISIDLSSSLASSDLEESAIEEDEVLNEARRVLNEHLNS